MENTIPTSKLSNNNNALTKLADHSLSTNDGLLSPMERPHDIDSSKDESQLKQKKPFFTFETIKDMSHKVLFIISFLLIILCLT